MLYVLSHQQRLVEEDLFAFDSTDLVPEPVLLSIALIPLKAGAFEQLVKRTRHIPYIYQIYTVVKEPTSTLAPTPAFRSCSVPARGIR